MFMVQQTPTTVLIDKDGVVRKLVIGTNGQKRHDMLEAIKEVSAVRCDRFEDKNTDKKR